MKRMEEIVAELLEGGNAAAIGITGQMHGVVYLNADGQAIGPLTIWQDGRGDQPYHDGMTYASYLSEQTSYPVATGYGSVTHYYNTVNGLVPAGAVTFCTIHDLAAMQLTGRKIPLLHPSDAASFGLYDLEHNRFDEEVIKKSGMDPTFFPAVAVGYAVVGYTSDGIPVAVAIGDNQASVLGSVQDLDHSILVNVGTGSQVSCVVSAVEHSEMDCRSLTERQWLLVGSSLCGGRAYAILKEFLRQTAEIVTGQTVKSAYPAMDKLMADYVPAAHPLTVDTAFRGTRSQPDRRGKIVGIDIENMTMANLCDGVMNGMVQELYDLYTRMRPILANEPTRLIGSGNGIRFNHRLSQRFSAKF